MWRRLFFALCLWGLTASLLYSETIEPMTPAPLPEASWQKLPRWRGFNLLNQYSAAWSHRPFVEDDFRLIHQLGFNFVRLPLDYRIWIEGGDWNKIDEKAFKGIDQAVEWGKKYGIHVCLNFHRAPGYCINPPAEKENLWTSEEAQKVCAKHWAFFARRYKGHPNRELSFDLFNEPTGADNATYARVAAVMCKAIRSEDPDRLIICDGNEAGTIPVDELIPLQVAQSTRGYQPFGLTHYKAPWVKGSQNWVEPRWPATRISSFIYGKNKKDLQGPWLIEGPFRHSTTIRLRVHEVSDSAHLIVKADAKTILDKLFKCGPGEGEWKKSVYREEWKIYQNLYDLDVKAEVPSGVKKLSIEVQEGDWLSIGELELTAHGSSPVTILPTTTDWGYRPSTFYLDSNLLPDPEKNTDVQDAAWHWKECVEPWKALEAKGVGVMVGEWGVYNKTPHKVMLGFAKDVLSNWEKAGWGWALWNFSGDFGPLDSKREDVAYEDWEGHQLDRPMMDLLQKY
jgi:aryl-phospho-beta-D-glucosidase BglC (GH1 family)